MDGLSYSIPPLVVKLVEAVRNKWDPQFKVLHFDEIPWTPVTKPLSESKIALVSSAGVYHKDQKPFDAAHPQGDTSIRFIDYLDNMQDIKIAHDHYDHKFADEDINVVFPLDRLKELEKQEKIKLADTHYSLSGYITRPLPDLLDNAKKIVEQIVKENVDLVLLVPV